MRPGVVDPVSVLELLDVPQSLELLGVDDVPASVRKYPISFLGKRERVPVLGQADAGVNRVEDGLAFQARKHFRSLRKFQEELGVNEWARGGELADKLNWPTVAIIIQESKLQRERGKQLTTQNNLTNK